MKINLREKGLSTVVIIGAYTPIVGKNGAWYAKGWPPLL